MPSATATLRDQVIDLFSDPAVRQAALGGTSFTMQDRDALETLQQQMGGILADASAGRVLTGPQWLGGTSIVDGTITAGKLTVNSVDAITINSGSLNVTGTIKAAASFPAVAARIELNSTGLIGYQADGVTSTFKLLTTGAGEIGSGANKVSWTTSGVVTIPAALIGSLTIGDVGSGTVGGTYATAGANPKITLSTTGITAYDASGNTTFSLVTSTGAMTATGNFTIQSATSGSRVVISNAGGIEGYNSTTRTFFINAATGAGILGITGGAGSNSIEWDQTGVKIGGVSLSSGKITASSLSVTSLSAISADMGTITAGTITAAAITTGTLSAARISGGTLGGGYTVPAGQAITLNASGSVYDCLKLQYSGADQGGLYAASGDVFLQYGTTGGVLDLTSSSATLAKSPTSVILVLAGATGVTISTNVSGTSLFDTSGNLKLQGDYYPHGQTTRYVSDDGSRLVLAANALRVNLSRTGTAQNWPTGGSPTSVIMSTDAGSTLQSIGCEYVTINFNGTDRKVLCVA
jgi:hypothetical protein